MTAKGELGAVKVSSKGQVTLPVKVLQRLGLERGDFVIFSEEGGRVVMEAAQLTPKRRGVSPR